MACANSTKNARNPLKRCLSMPTMMPSELKSRPGPIRPVEAVCPAYYVEEPEEKYKGKLEIDEKVEDVITLENETALFECKVVQDIKPTCTWHKDGNTLQSDDERISVIKNSAWHRLEIKHVTASDQGIYTIECRHNQEYISIKGHLYVAPRPLNDGVFYHKIAYTGTGVIQHLHNVKLWKGDTIKLEAKFNYASDEYIWYKNNDVVLQDRRTTVSSSGTTTIMTIKCAKPTDAGVYFAVAKTEQGYLSTFADVQVGDPNEIQRLFPIIDEYFPDEVETVVGEEVRFALKAFTDTNTIVRWFKDGEEILTDDCVRVDYGNNYIGLTIPDPSELSAGEYGLTLQSTVTQRAVGASLRLTVNQRPSNPPEVNLLRPLESAVACCGSKVSFDCRFDLEDPMYFYVVWYIGHYKVERTNSLFNVISNGGQYLLYIKKVEPSMAGDIICELRRAWTHKKTVMIKRAYGRLVIVPRLMIQEAKIHPVLNGKLYYERDADEISIRVENADDDTRSLADIEVEFLLKIVYCRLDEEGLHFVHAVRGLKTAPNTYLNVGQGHSKNKSVAIEWNNDITPCESWYGIELGQPNGSFLEAGVTSRPIFLVENPPLDRMMIFRIRAVTPMNIKSSEVYIVPPPEIVLRLAIPHEIEPMEAFIDKYMNTGETIGTGTFGSVVLVKEKQDETCHAAKFLKAKIQKKRDSIYREFHIMKNLHHPKLIQLLGFYEAAVTFVFVMEYCWGGELFDRVVGDEYMREVDVVDYVKQICEGLEYMHQNGIVHLDLKPENIMCMSPNSKQVKLIDFGVARSVTENMVRAIYGTRDYVAPEVIDYEPISTATDMWSLGVVTYMLLSGNTPFIGESWAERSANITRASYDYDDYAFEEISDLAKDFVDHVLLRRPTQRLSATKALQHPWVVEGPPQGRKAKRMHKMQQNLKSYLADYRLRWQRAGNVMIAARRLRMRGNHHNGSPSSGESPSP